MLVLLFLSILFLNFFSTFLSAKVYLTQAQFLAQIEVKINARTEAAVITKLKPKTLWLNKKVQSEITKIMGHKYPKLRLRYKESETSDEIIDGSLYTTIWFLQAIGKERPISFGIAIRNNQIIDIQVLEFRESRGFEISISAFSKQFDDAALERSNKLNKNINGITGATMSVNAMKKIARVALMLHAFIYKSYNELKE